MQYVACIDKFDDQGSQSLKGTVDVISCDPPLVYVAGPIHNGTL